MTGGYVYRGSEIPGMVGRYIYADYEVDRIWIFTYDGEALCDRTSGVENDIDPEGELTQISSFGQDPDGEIYVATLGPGNVFRLVPR